MGIYIVLGQFTLEGIKNIKDSPTRLQQANQVAKSIGGEIKEFYYTMGQYDFVAVVEGPNNEAVIQALFTIGSIGAVKTETLAAISSEKAAEILKKVP